MFGSSRSTGNGGTGWACQWRFFFRKKTQTASWAKALADDVPEAADDGNELLNAAALGVELLPHALVLLAHGAELGGDLRRKYK
jgi:hypothetical protein